MILRQQARRVILPDGTRALVIDSIVPDSASPAVKNGLALRAAVNGGETCACGARLTTPDRAARRRAARLGELLRLVVEHASDCPASTATILSALGRS